MPPLDPSDDRGAATIAEPRPSRIPDAARANQAPDTTPGRGVFGNLYDRITGKAPAGIDTPDPFNLPDLTPEMYEELWGQPAFTGPSFNVGAPDTGPQRIGQGPMANKMLPVDEAGGRASKIVAAAQSMVGLPYVWGGTSAAKGVDCSGLVYLAYKSIGITLPRLSADQMRTGRRVSLDALRPGDLVGWDNSSRNNGADHIAIYVGGGRIIEAPRPGEQVRVRRLGSNEGAFATRVIGGN